MHIPQHNDIINCLIHFVFDYLLFAAALQGNNDVTWWRGEQSKRDCEFENKKKTKETL